MRNIDSTSSASDWAEPFVLGIVAVAAMLAAPHVVLALASLIG